MTLSPERRTCKDTAKFHHAGDVFENFLFLIFLANRKVDVFEGQDGGFHSSCALLVKTLDTAFDGRVGSLHGFFFEILFRHGKSKRQSLAQTKCVILGQRILSTTRWKTAWYGRAMAVLNLTLGAGIGHKPKIPFRRTKDVRTFRVPDEIKGTS